MTLYSKGDTFTLIYYNNKVGVITGEGQKYKEIKRKYQSFVLLYLASDGELHAMDLNLSVVSNAYNTIVYYPVLVGDQRGWINEELIKIFESKIEDNDAV